MPREGRVHFFSGCERAPCGSERARAVDPQQTRAVSAPRGALLARCKTRYEEMLQEAVDCVRDHQ
eukprot:3781743-Pyramimonas_sp.AAC.1